MMVSWIDSKAMFGDELTYVQEHQSQLLSYVNRWPFLVCRELCRLLVKYLEVVLYALIGR